MRWVLILALAGCQAASSDPGTDAFMVLAGGQFVPHDFPHELNGPEVVGTELSVSQIVPGEVDHRFKAFLGEDATAAAIGLAGDRGYWIVVAGPPDVVTPESLSVDVRLSFSPDLPLGPRWLTVRAVSADGGYGIAERVEVTAVTLPPPEGMLVFSLAWDTEADLDLHVIDPAGIEIWAGNINSYQPPPPGQPPDDPDAWMAGGILDDDSNAGCVIDGRRVENVVWAMPAPPGHYQVLVETTSLCGKPSARWTASALIDGAEVAAARGESLPVDTEELHGAGAGQLAFEVDVP